MEQHFSQFSFGQSARGFRETRPDSIALCLNPLVVDAAAVVFHFNVNVVATVIGAHRKILPCSGLPARTIFRAFNSVRHGIAHQVNQGVRNLLDDIVIEFRLASREIQLHLFLGGFGGVSHGAREQRDRGCRSAPCAPR